jgi:iron(III) transport system substrate-binding protein
LLCLAVLSACAPPAPAVSQAPAGSNTGTSDWQRIVDAAKAEGSVLVYQNTFPGAEGTKIAEEFKRQTGITADFISGSGAPLSQRLRTETQGGQPSADIMEGSSQFLGPMQKDGFFVSIKDKGLPTLAEPASTWRVKPTYFSETQELFVSRPLTTYAAHVVVNTRMMSPSEYPSSYHELMSDPKYKGKIGYIDPKTTGDAAAVYIRQGYVGESVTLSDFWTLYANQDPVLYPAPGDQGAATGRGEVAISIGATFGSLLQQANANAPIKLLAFADAPIVSNPATMGVLKTARHPNAALVFVDWFYSKPGQDYIIRLLQLPSVLRRDVDSQVPAALKPEVVGGGKRGPEVVLTGAQSALAAALNGAQIFQRLPEGIPQAEFESKAKAFMADWEAKNGGPQKERVVLQD